MHAEHQDGGLLVVDAQAAHERKSSEHGRPDGQVDNDDGRLVRAKLAEAVRHARRLDDACHRGILQDARAPLQHKWMIVDDQDSWRG